MRLRPRVPTTRTSWISQWISIYFLVTFRTFVCLSWPTDLCQGLPYKLEGTPFESALLAEGFGASQSSTTSANYAHQLNLLMNINTFSGHFQDFFCKLSWTFVPWMFVPWTFVPWTFVPWMFVPWTFFPWTFVPWTFAPWTFVPWTFVPWTFVPWMFVLWTFVLWTFVLQMFVPWMFVPQMLVPRMRVHRMFVPQCPMGNFISDIFEVTQCMCGASAAVVGSLSSYFCFCPWLLSCGVAMLPSKKNRKVATAPST